MVDWLSSLGRSPTAELRRRVRILWLGVRCIVAERRLRPRRGYSAEVMTWGGGGEVEDLGFGYRMVASTTGMIESIAIIPIRLAYFSGLSLTISSSLDPFWT